MVDLKMSGATAVDAAGAVSRGSGLGGNSRRTVDNIRATADPTATDDSGSGYHVGSLWYRPSTGEMWTCTDATSTAAVWVPRAGQYASPRDRFYAFTDCVIVPGYTAGSDAAFIQSYSGTGAVVNTIGITTLNALGIVSLDLGTTTTGRASVSSSATSGVKLGSGRARFASKAAVHVLSSGTETFTTRLGFIDSNSGESTDGCFFRYTDGVNSGEWQAVTRSNGTETATDTNIAVVADAWKLFEIDVNAAGTSVVFKIDGTTVATNTTNIPTGSGRETGYGAMALKSAGTTATSAVYLDWLEVEYLFTTRR